jgi:hypothetical protein
MQDTGENAIEEVGLDHIRFRVPVLHGDTLYSFTEVVHKEDEPPDARGHKNVGLVHFRHWGVNQRGETVFEGERRVLVKRRAFVAEGIPEIDHTTSEPAQMRSKQPPSRKHSSPIKTKARTAKTPRMIKTARGSKPSPPKRRGRR